MCPCCGGRVEPAGRRHSERVRPPFGVDAVAGKATLAFDLIGRTLIDAGRFGDVTRTFPLLGGIDGDAQRNSAAATATLNQVLGAATSSSR